MSTLIIHPQDHSTDFLDIVYKDIPNKLVIRNSFSKDDIKELIVEFDRVMMMGHGSPSGLFSVGQFDVDGAFIIDNSFVDILSEKEDSVYIWCHADQFVEANNLKGFYSGMFFSEVIKDKLAGKEKPLLNFSSRGAKNANFLAIHSCYIGSRFFVETIL